MVSPCGFRCSCRCIVFTSVSFSQVLAGASIMQQAILNFMPGATRPQPQTQSTKRKQTTEEQKIKHREYDATKRQWQSLPKWERAVYQTRRQEQESEVQCQWHLWQPLVFASASAPGQQLTESLAKVAQPSYQWWIWSWAYQQLQQKLKEVSPNWNWSRLLRSCMKDSLSDQLMVMLEGPDIPDFNPKEAIDLWTDGGCKSRRPGFRARNDPRTVKADTDSSLSDTDFESQSLSQCESESE